MSPATKDRLDAIEDYQNALQRAVRCLDGLKTAKPGSAMAASLADNLAQHVQALTANAQYLFRSSTNVRQVTPTNFTVLGVRVGSAGDK